MRRIERPAIESNLKLGDWRRSSILKMSLTNRSIDTSIDTSGTTIRKNDIRIQLGQKMIFSSPSLNRIPVSFP